MVLIILLTGLGVTAYNMGHTLYISSHYLPQPHYANEKTQRLDDTQYAKRQILLPMYGIYPLYIVTLVVVPIASVLLIREKFEK